MRPLVHGVEVDRDDVLVGQQEDGLQGLVGALPYIHQPVCVDFRQLERRVAVVQRVQVLASDSNLHCSELKILTSRGTRCAGSRKRGRTPATARPGPPAPSHRKTQSCRTKNHAVVSSARSRRKKKPKTRLKACLHLLYTNGAPKPFGRARFERVSAVSVAQRAPQFCVLHGDYGGCLNTLLLGLPGVFRGY